MEKWNSLEKKIYLLKTYYKDGERYLVFFRYTPTPFKVRGEYVVLNIQNKQGIREFLEKYHDYSRDFEYINGEVQLNETIPDILIDTETEFYLDYFKVDNTSIEINDILDVLDLIDHCGGAVYLNAENSPEILRRYLEDGNSEFTLSDRNEDYVRPVVEFMSSSEHPTLSYRFVLKGKVMENGYEVDRHKYFSYKILSDIGELEVDTLDFIIYDEKYLETIYKYLSNYLIGGVEKVSKGVKVSIDTTKLRPIETIHEQKIAEDLIKQREQLRLLIKSKNAFKKSVRSLAEKTGVPIPGRFSNLYLEDIKDKSSNYKVKLKTEYKNSDTIAGKTPFNKILELAKIKNMGYVDTLITNYLQGKVEDSFIDLHLTNASNVFKNELLNYAFQDLFSSIKGRTSLSEMYKDADSVSNGIEYYYNLVKIKLTPFGQFTGKDVDDFIYRMYTCDLEDTKLLGEDAIYIRFLNGLEINIKTEVTI